MKNAKANRNIIASHTGTCTDTQTCTRFALTSHLKVTYSGTHSVATLSGTCSFWKLFNGREPSCGLNVSFLSSLSGTIPLSLPANGITSGRWRLQRRPRTVTRPFFYDFIISPSLPRSFSFARVGV